MEERTTVLVAAGNVGRDGGLGAVLHPKQRVIAVDGGLGHLRVMDRVPEVVVGDLDSASEEDLGWARSEGADIIHLSGQDESDLSKALELCSQQGWTRVLVAGVDGGRHDHEFGTYAALAAADPGLEIRVILEQGQIVRCTDFYVFTSKAEFSLFALCPTRLSITGAKYLLSDEWLELSTRGLSNSIENYGRVEIHEGGPVLIFILD